LAVGYTLDELPNDITRETMACFEPTIDYVVTKVPRFAFEKFPGADSTLGPQMKSVGEVMAIGRTFQGISWQGPALAGDRPLGFDLDRVPPLEELKRLIHEPGPDRLWQLAEALRAGLSVDEAYAITAIDPWFLEHVDALVKEDESARIDGAKLLDDPVSLAPAQAHGHVGSPPDEAGRRERRRRAPGAHQVRHPACIQAGRHLRRRVRGAHAIPI